MVFVESNKYVLIVSDDGKAKRVLHCGKDRLIITVLLMLVYPLFVGAAMCVMYYF